MPLHVLTVLEAVAQAGLHLAGEQPLDDVLGIGGEILLELELAPHHPLSDDLPVGPCVTKRRTDIRIILSAVLRSRSFLDRLRLQVLFFHRRRLLLI